jgi:hypothetical protein
MPIIRVETREIREEFKTYDIEVSKQMLKKPKDKLKKHILKKIDEYDYEDYDWLGDNSETLVKYKKTYWR